MRFEPNLSMLFTELPLIERPRAAAAAGFGAAEMWWPFDRPDPSDADVAGLASAFEEAGISLACLNFYGGDFDAGERGLAAVPGDEERFRSNIDIAVGLADRLGCTTLNALYGNRVADSSPEAQEAVAIENLTLAVAAASRIGARVVVEPLNSIEYPRYGLHSVEDVIALADRARRSSGIDVWCSFDMYHATMSGDRLEVMIERYADRIGHVQIADAPGRHEPGTGTVDFATLLAMLRQHGYDGWIGLEYIPSSDSHSSLRTVMDLLLSQSETSSHV